MNQAEALSRAAGVLLEMSNEASSPERLLDALLAAVSAIDDPAPEHEGALLLADGGGHPIPVACRGVVTTGELEPRRLTSRPFGSNATVIDRHVVLRLLHDDGRPCGFLVIAPFWTDWKVLQERLELLEALVPILSLALTRAIVLSIAELRDFETQLAELDALQRLVVAEELHDIDNGLHVLRVAHYCKAIASAAGLDGASIDLIFKAAVLHDIGKIAISDAILRSPRHLSDAEFEIVKTHTLIGEQILSGKGSVITVARVIAGSHHERWDGTGYPRGLRETDIPLHGRICAIADVFDALATRRPYKEPWEIPDILDYMSAQAGTQFDPNIVEAFFAALPEILKFREVYSDQMLLTAGSNDLVPVSGSGRASLVWQDDYASGIHTIDVHHRYLFELTDELAGALRQGGRIGEVAAAFKALESYTRIHFREEERLMKECGYRRLAQHRREHADFITTLEEGWDAMHRNPLFAGHGLLEFLKRWLVDHITISDKHAAREILGATPNAIDTRRG
jgi:hemerythrin-like metal-binding protein